MPSFTIGDLHLTQDDFDTTVELKMPRALGHLLARLGSSFFQFDAASNEFIPSPQSQELCRVIERRPGLSNEQIETNAVELRRAVKAAYDTYTQMDPPENDQVFRPAP